MTGEAQCFPDQAFEPVSGWRASNSLGNRNDNPGITQFLWKITKSQKFTGTVPAFFKQKIDRFFTL